MHRVRVGGLDHVATMTTGDDLEDWSVCLVAKRSRGRGANASITLFVKKDHGYYNHLSECAEMVTLRSKVNGNRKTGTVGVLIIGMSVSIVVVTPLDTISITVTIFSDPAR